MNHTATKLHCGIIVATVWTNGRMETKKPLVKVSVESWVRVKVKLLVLQTRIWLSASASLLLILSISLFLSLPYHSSPFLPLPSSLSLWFTLTFSPLSVPHSISLSLFFLLLSLSLQDFWLSSSLCLYLSVHFFFSLIILSPTLSSHPSQTLPHPLHL